MKGPAQPSAEAARQLLAVGSGRGFRVTGSHVRWGRFRGTVAPDNGLQMVSGTTWVYGQFVGDRFQGEISFWGAFDNPGCTYVMELRKTGA